MAKKIVKKKKTSRPAPKQRVSRAKSGKPLPRRSHASRPRVAIAEVTRVGSRARPSELSAYYAMGGLTVAIALAVVIYQGLKGSAQPQTAKNLPAPQTQVFHGSQLNGQLVSEFSDIQAFSFPEKLNYWSSYIEKNKTGRKKISELSGRRQIDDTAPIIPNEYDCTTFIEVVAALSRSSSEDQFLKNLFAIRYKDGQPTFVNRNHFPEADWIPNNQAAQILSDITSDLARQSGVETHFERKKIDRVKWFKEQADGNKIERSLASLAEKRWPEPSEVQLPYIAISDVKKIMKQIPSGTILNLVHRSDPHHPVLITHQGFVIREGNQVLLRHASVGGRIRTNNLSQYLTSLHGQQRPNSRWPLIGINLNQINVSTSATSLRSDSR
jgi:hypothetical protein